VCICIGRAPSFMPSQTPDRLISRFFINLRSIYSQSQITATEGQIGPSMISGTRADTFWTRASRFTTGLPIGFRGETSTYGDLPSQIETYGPQAGTVDVEVAMELRTRHDGGKVEMVLSAPGLTVKEDKLVSA
jgi:hypothetical protein